MRQFFANGAVGRHGHLYVKCVAEAPVCGSPGGEQQQRHERDHEDSPAMGEGSGC